MGGKKASPSSQRAPGMRRANTQKAEDWAVLRVHNVVAEDLKWFFRVEPPPDYGVDAQAEIVADDDLVTGRRLGIQIKGGESHFSRPKGNKGWTFSESNDHLAYWLGSSLPIVLVLVDSERQAFWQAITTATVKENKKTFTVFVPRDQPFDATARDALQAFAGPRAGLLEQLGTNYAVLPPATVNALSRAEAIDRLAAARLAERLAAGRDNAGRTAASIINTRPSWVVGSAAAEDLWNAVALYAHQHNSFAEAGVAFSQAADCEGPRSARSSAEAGLALIPSDRDRARQHLVRAREQGQILLADIGLSQLELPEGHGSPPTIPPSVSGATSEELEAEPTALLFLAEAANRREELNKAVAYAERAAEHAGDHDTVAKLILAVLIHRRALSGDMSSRELRRSIGYVREVVEERRRWDGPSADAMALLLDIYLSDDMAAALSAALPGSHGGTARDREAYVPEIARRGALAALATDHESAYRFFMEQLPDGPYRRELEVLESDAHGRPEAERIAARRALLEDSADDQMTARNVAALVKAGVWPEQADQLRAREVLPVETYRMLKAIYDVRSGNVGIGIARLRELAVTSAHAAAELVEILEETAGPDSAIDEAKSQLLRRPVPSLTLKLLDLLGKYGYDEQAAEMIERHQADDSLPIDVRLRLANWYVARKGSLRRFAEAAEFAAKSLEAGNDPDLAWNLVKSLFGDARVPAAREALARHRPEPVRDDEMRLWMQLHLGVSLTPDDALTMVDIAQRQPDGQFRDRIIAVLVREVLLTPPEPGARFSTELTESVQRLQVQVGSRRGSAIHVASDDDESLRIALGGTEQDPEAYRALLTQVWEGRASLADVASSIGRPYGTALLQRPAGIIPAVDLRPGLRQAGETAAEHALLTGACVADLSSLHLLNLVGDENRLYLRAAMPTIIVARSVVGDIILTRDQMRDLAIAAFTVVLRPDGTVERTSLTAAQQATLSKQSEELETLAASLERRSSSSTDNAVGDTIALAKNGGYVLWCDDGSLRQKARQTGVAAFSILDLVTVLRRGGQTIDEHLLLRDLAAEYVVDLPLGPDDVIAIADAGGWSRGPAQTLLARPEWWRYQGNDWVSSWLLIAIAARRHSATAFLDVTRAALIGAIAYVAPGQSTQRYQRLVVVALLACHHAGKQPPDGLLAELARPATPGLAPSPRYVLMSLVAELEAQAVQDAVEVARKLLPGVDLA